jgi:hypothetical protein
MLVSAARREGTRVLQEIQARVRWAASEMMAIIMTRA